MMNIPKTLTSFFWHYIKLQWVAFLILFITALIWAINEAFFPFFIKLIVDAVHDFKGAPSTIFSVVKLPVILLVSIWIAMDLSMRLQGIVMIYALPRFRANIRQSVYAYIKQHSFDYFANHFAGSIANKLSDLANSSQRVVEICIYNFIGSTVVFLIALVLMGRASLLFLGIALAWFCIHLGLTFLFLRKGRDLYEEHAESATTLSGKVVDSLTNIISVHLFAREPYEKQFFSKYQKEEIEKARAAMWHLEKMRVFQGIAGVSFILAMVFTLIYSWSHDSISLGDFSLVTMLSFNILGQVWFMSYQMSIFVNEISTIKSALNLVNVKHSIVDVQNAPPLKVSKGEIRFDRVTFKYPQKQNPIFDEILLTIPPGQKVGLVGFTGAGKSTFVHLILRFYDLSAGKILIDDQDISIVQQNSLRSQIALIPQDPTLFHRTLMENIRYGRIEATDDEVMAAAKLAHCHSFIEKLKEGYDSLVGERGIKLSGGQRQRIAIARAILKNAPILILDEATSSLDSVTEQLIQESMAHLMQNRTTIVIAHRLSTLLDMDRILVFHKGNIVEDGARETLLTANGHFAKLWNMQVNGFLPP